MQKWWSQSYKDHIVLRPKWKGQTQVLPCAPVSTSLHVYWLVSISNLSTRKTATNQKLTRCPYDTSGLCYQYGFFKPKCRVWRKENIKPRGTHSSIDVSVVPVDLAKFIFVYKNQSELLFSIKFERFPWTHSLKPLSRDWSDYDHCLSLKYMEKQVIF